MPSNQSQSAVLLSLASVDGKLLVVTREKKDIEAKRELSFKEIAALKQSADQLEAQKALGSTRQELEQSRLKDEERKIVERRKQLTALGGTRGAKLVEREIDIATRTLQTMEQKALTAMAEVDGYDAKIAVLRTQLDEKQLAFEEANAQDDSRMAELEKEIKTLSDERDQLAQQLEDRTRNLYNRVNQRYTGTAVAKAEAAACRACFRSLPAQTFNQVLAGNVLIQCPGCSRILVAPTPES